MPMISLRQLLDHAAEYGYGMPAFNVNNMEQILAVMNAARKTNSPVIVQTSKGARSYAGDVMIHNMVQAAAEMYPELPICLHQDHGDSYKTCVTALANGWTSVMMDGSLKDGKPASHEYNAEVSAKVVETAHMIGASVEAELGCIGSLETGKGEKEDGHGFEGALDKKQLLTDPDEAFDFVKQTNVDALAVAIGTSHGAYKFTRKPDGAILSIDTIKKIHAKIPTVHLVMHGSSSVPQQYVDIINKYGGKLEAAVGIPEEQLRQAAPFAKFLRRSRANSTFVNTWDPRWKKWKRSALRVTNNSERPVMPTRSKPFACPTWQSVMLPANWLTRSERFVKKEKAEKKISAFFM